MFRSLFVVLMMLSSLPAAADLEDRLIAAMQSETRSEADRARDANRKPIETLKFFGLREDMRVLELIPGGGWYTKLLAPALEEKGKLYVALGTGRVASMIDAGELRGVEVVKVDQTASGRDPVTRRTNIDGLKIHARDIDLAVTFRNMHNFNAATRAALNEEVFRVLKKGGLYGVVDHTRRHMQAQGPENGRRMDPVKVIKEVQAVGFQFVDYSDLHYRLDDELVYEVGRRSVAGNTDRFTLLFRKP